jgi:hypothetical protein
MLVGLNVPGIERPSKRKVPVTLRVPMSAQGSRSLGREGRRSGKAVPKLDVTFFLKPPEGATMLYAQHIALAERLIEQADHRVPQECLKDVEKE